MVCIFREDLKLSNVNRGIKQILTKCCQATHPGDIFFLSSWDFCYCDFLRNRLLFLSDLASSTLKRTNKINLSHLLMVPLHQDTYPFAPIHFYCCFTQNIKIIHGKAFLVRLLEGKQYIGHYCCFSVSTHYSLNVYCGLTTCAVANCNQGCKCNQQ